MHHSEVRRRPWNHMFPSFQNSAIDHPRQGRKHSKIPSSLILKKFGHLRRQKTPNTVFRVSCILFFIGPILDPIFQKMNGETLKCWFCTPRRKLEILWTFENKKKRPHVMILKCRFRAFWNNDLVKLLKSLQNFPKWSLRCRFGYFAP